MNTFKRISILQAKEVLNQENALLVDIRDISDYIYHNDETALHLSQDNLPSFVQSTDKEVPVVVMCYHGNSSQGVAQYLASEGFGKVYSLDGGYELWKLQNI